MKKIKHVRGNPLRVAIPLTRRIRMLVDGKEVEVTEDFIPNPAYPVSIVLTNQYKKFPFTATMDGHIAKFVDEGKLPVGTYQVEVLCHDEDGIPSRYMVRSIIEIVDATIDAGIEAGIEFDAETHTLEGSVFFYAKGDKGDRGEQGIQGIQGAQGERGEHGVSVISMQQIKTSHASGGVNVIRQTLSNGLTYDFEVMNGEKIVPVYEDGTLTI